MECETTATTTVTTADQNTANITFVIGINTAIMTTTMVERTARTMNRYNPATLVWNCTYLPVVVEQPVVTQPVEVITTPAVVDYGYRGYYGHGHHRYHDPGHHGNRDRHHNNFHRERR